MDRQKKWDSHDGWENFKPVLRLLGLSVILNTGDLIQDLD